MADVNPTRDHVRKVVLVVLALGTTVLFLWMIREFLMALLLSAILSGMFHPLYKRLLPYVRGRKGAASAATIAFAVLVVIIPLAGFFAIVADQAVRIGRQARPWVEQNLAQADGFKSLLETLPALEFLQPYRAQVLPKLGELAATAGSWSVHLATSAAREAATFFLMLFIALYAMYFFLIDGRRALDKMLYYLPLPPEDEARMMGHFVSVTRATLKSTLVIAVIQGGLGGMAFWVVGIDGAALWGTVMAVLSAIPGLGHAIVWIPAAIYLGAVDRWTACLGLVLFCGLVIGSIDNFLRPRLVGRDTKLPDLMILLSTLGGLLLFGAAGFIVGPIIAAMLVTVWELYGTAFKDILPPVPVRASSLPPTPTPSPPKVTLRETPRSKSP
jgi:predicted PurR-regulated permease PerM